MKFLDKLSMNEVLTLHRKRVIAENKGDKKILAELKLQYPGLFSSEFNDFIVNLTITVEYLKYKYGHDFSKLTIPSEQDFLH